MEIVSCEHSADSYYLRTRDVEPDIKDGVLHIYNGDNGRRGNKWCKVENNVIHQNNHLVSVLCSWTCRHSGGQFWRHYLNGERVMWKRLDDGDRMAILDAFFESAPSWAATPGKLKREYFKPKELQRLEIDEQGTIYGYKYLRLSDTGSFHSVAAVSKGVEWVDMEIEANEIPTETNTNGIYAMKSRKNSHLLDYKRDGRKLVRLALSGVVVEANEGLRAQHAQIVEVIE